MKAEGGVISGEQFVDECQVESDLELLLPATYVTGSSERMLLYRELDSLTLDKDVEAFRNRLIDRFGPGSVRNGRVTAYCAVASSCCPPWCGKGFS